MSAVIFGIDPGVSGAIAVQVDGQAIEVFDIPALPAPSGKGRRVSPAMLADQLGDWMGRWPVTGGFRHVAVMEDVAAMPTDSGPSAFAFGRAIGNIEATFLALGVGVEMVRPGVWKKALGLTMPSLPKDPERTAKEARRLRGERTAQLKDASRALAARLYPTLAGRLVTKNSDGRAEALLIGHWWLKEGRKDAPVR